MLFLEINKGFIKVIEKRKIMNLKNYYKINKKKQKIINLNNYKKKKNNKILK